jgi:hypothetical protein
VVLGVAVKQADSLKSRCILIDITLCLSNGNRKIIALLDSGIDEVLISQRFVKENRLQVTLIGRISVAVNEYQITIYETHELEIKVKNNYNIV